MAEPERQSEESGEQESPFASALGSGRERFLAHLVERSLKCGQRTPEDFIRHFPPAAIMVGLRDRPSLRANILVATTGIKSRIAVKKSSESAGEDLQIALDEKETTPDTVVDLFHPDDRVRYLSDKALWQFFIEDEFWDAPASDAEASKRATEHVAFVLDRALQDKLITHKDIVDGISVDRIAKVLPRSELEKIIRAALTAGENKRRFTEGGLLRAVGSQTLLKHVPLNDIWNSMVVPKIAEAHGFVEAREVTKDGETPPAYDTKDIKKFSPANTNKSAAGTADGAGAEKGAAAKTGPGEGVAEVDVEADLDGTAREARVATSK
ncbi:MAG: hypothetical protein PVH21_18190, partial [Myxococcales bacterium]|jgi:hypothetical protein